MRLVWHWLCSNLVHFVWCVCHTGSVNHSECWTWQLPGHGAELLLTNWRQFCYRDPCLLLLCLFLCGWLFLFVTWRKIMRPVMQVSRSLDGCSPTASLHHLPTVTKLSSQQDLLDLSLCLRTRDAREGKTVWLYCAFLTFCVCSCSCINACVCSQLVFVFSICVYFMFASRRCHKKCSRQQMLGLVAVWQN